MASAKCVGLGSPIARWYEGKTVFMTGGTGFMGKVIVERLLWTCPGIKKIYALVRPKKGEDVNERMDQIKDGQVFDNIRKKYGSRLEKIQAINGDLELPNLGLSASDAELLRDVFDNLRQNYPQRLELFQALDGDIALPDLGLSASDVELLRDVNVVFNVAATVNFTEDLRSSVTTNVLATKAMLDIALTMKDLQAFVHVSTAYANSDRNDIIEERIYPAPTDLDQLIKDCEKCSDEDIEELTTRALGNRQNTYVLTKALAENVVQEYKTKFPIAIVRPSVVTAALAHPFPGWVDFKTGSTGVIAAMGSGLLRVFRGKKHMIFDMVPVDIVDDAIIVAARRAANIGIGEPTVYNVTSGKRNPCSLSQLINLSTKYSLQFPQDTAVWCPSVIITSNWYIFKTGTFLMQTVPAFLHDILVPSSSKKIKSLIKTQSFIRKANNVTEYFTMNEFDFSDDNVQALIAEMTDEDRKTFNADVNSFDWKTYIVTYVQGIRRYLFRQKDADLPKARRRMTMYLITHRAIKLVTAAGITYYVAMHVATPYLVTAIL